MATNIFPDGDKPPREPKVNQRFVYTLKFGGRKLGEKKTVMLDLNADGYVDYAHQVGLQEIRSQLIERRLHEDDEGNQTWWATVHVTVILKDGTSATGLSCVSSRDQRVSSPGNEVAVAETRAIKRAIGTACNINEEKINPDGEEPTRETVDMPLRDDKLDETGMFSDINKEIIRSKKDVMGDADDQFTV